MKKVEYAFCMKQFKPAIAGLAILVVATLGWTGWHCTQKQHKTWNLSLAAAANRLTAGSLGLKTQTVTAAMMRKFGLANEDGVLILEVAPNSIAAKAGLRKGDEIIRAGKTRVETRNDFEAVLDQAKPGSNLKLSIYRGTRQRNLFVVIPKNLSGGLGPAAAAAPMTQNQIETLAEQLGVPKTQQDVARALKRQKQGQVAANLNYGKVAVAAVGSGLDYQVSHGFGASPYFIVYDPGQNTYRVVANPNANDATGRGIQTGQYVVDLGASNVVAGNFSQNALHTLHTLRVNVFSGVIGSVRDVLSAYMAGKLAPTNTGLNLRAARPGRNTSPRVGSQNLQPIY